MPIKIRAIENRDFPDWLPLWDGNNLGQRNEKITSETWSRLNDPDSTVHGLVAEEDGKLVGLVHYILHPTTGSLQDVCYMQDVYTAPENRRKGIAKKLIAALTKQGSGKWARMYWLAEADNVAAQTLYEKLGVKMNFTLHMLPL